MLNYLPDSSAADGHKFFATGERKLEERQAAEKASDLDEEPIRKDIFHYLFQSRDPETDLGFSHAQLVADSGLLLAAGSDGVAVTVAAAVFYLLKNPDCMQKLIHEIQTSFSTSEEVRGMKVQQLKYLNGVVNEALRLAPSVPSGLPREVLPGGLRVDDLTIAAGTIVGVSAYSVHHNEDYFPDSFAFRPERWIGSTENVSLARRALCTFSAGRFDCIGKNIAVLACKLVLAKMLLTYELRAADGNVTGGGGLTGSEMGRARHDEYQLDDFLVSYRSGPMVAFRSRQRGL